MKEKARAELTPLVEKAIVGAVLGSWDTEGENEVCVIGGTCETPGCLCAAATILWLFRPHPSEARDFHETVRPEIRRRLAEYLERPLPPGTIIKEKPRRRPFEGDGPEVLWRMSFDVPK